MSFKKRLAIMVSMVAVLALGVFLFFTITGKNKVAADDASTTISFLGKTYEYRNIGREYMVAQNYIDAAPDTHVSTWGGKAIQLDNDGHNTHFIGHTPGVFNDLSSLKIGDKITVKDIEGNVRDYTVTEIYEVDDYGNLENDKSKNILQQMIGIGDREQVTFQTCMSDVENKVIVAY
jgi:hypothetical protein